MLGDTQPDEWWLFLQGTGIVLLASLLLLSWLLGKDR